jgi:hypothetical protein
MENKNIQIWINVLQLNQHLGGKNLPIKNDEILHIYIYMYVTYIFLLKMKYFCYRISTSIKCMYFLTTSFSQDYIENR